MRGQLRQIRSQLRRVRERIGQARLSRLPQALQRFAQTGQRPDDAIAATYLELSEAAQVCMAESVGGDGYEQACERYEQALAEWRRTLKKEGL